MMQEGARAGLDMDFLAALADIQPVEGLHRRLGLAFGGAEGGEIVLADQELRRRMHGLGIQLGRDMPDLAGFQRRRAAAVQDAEQIMPRRGGKAGMEFAVRLGGVQHRDRIGPQVIVQRIAHLARLEGLFQIEMRHLAQGMHPGIGAAGAGHRHALAGEFLDRRFQRALHRGAIVLALPADKRPAVIFQGQAIARHQDKAACRAARQSLSASSRASIAFAGALHLQQLQRAFAAGHRQIIGQDFAGLAADPLTGRHKESSAARH